MLRVDEGVVAGGAVSVADRTAIEEAFMAKKKDKKDKRDKKSKAKKKK